jgi:uncharacterized damage-inducible protein DinB
MSERELLLAQIDDAYNRRSWHGTNLRGSLRGLAAGAAVWRPGRARHNIQEIVVHAAYWKYAATRRLTGQKRGSFPLQGSNWFAREREDDALWRADLRLLEDAHRALRRAVAGISVRQLHRPLTGGRTAIWLVSGIVAHDLYHAGQIQLLKRLMASAD